MGGVCRQEVYARIATDLAADASRTNSAHYFTTDGTVGLDPRTIRVTTTFETAGRLCASGAKIRTLRWQEASAESGREDRRLHQLTLGSTHMAQTRIMATLVSNHRRECVVIVRFDCYIHPGIGVQRTTPRIESTANSVRRGAGTIGRTVNQKCSGPRACRRYCILFSKRINRIETISD